MSGSRPSADCPCARLRYEAALNILFDECAIAALSDAAVALRGSSDPAVADLEQAIRAHRIGIIKQRAVPGAAGIEV